MFTMVPTAATISGRLGEIRRNAMYFPQLVERCQSDEVIPFIGAGMSMPTFPLWGKFLLGTADKSGAKLKEDIRAKLSRFEYEEAASLARERLGWRLFEDLLQETFADKHFSSHKITGALSWLTHFKPGPLVTTNFDRMIESVFHDAGLPLMAVWHSYAIQGTKAFQRKQPFLLKLHGDWEDIEHRVLTKEDYNSAYGDGTAAKLDYELPIPQLLNILLSSRICLFLGCSLKQDRTIAILRLITDRHKTEHYAAVPLPEGDAATDDREQELSNMGIRPIWYPPEAGHAWLSPLLEYLAAKSRTPPRKAFLSGETHWEPPNNISKLTNNTLGRQEEIQQVANMLSGARLVMILGTGGCGKTRVAIEVAQHVKSRFQHGAWFADLANLSEKADQENLIPARIGSIVNIPQQPGRPPLDALVEKFGSDRHLLVLDNCEHLVTSCSALIAELITNCPNVRILATSRKALDVSDQQTYPLAPLRVPEANLALSELEENESVRLFLARAGKKFQLTEANAEAVTGLCRALDGLPLAIEIAAARLGVRSVQQMNKESRALMTLLEGVKADNLRHWGTLDAALEWSYKLLPKSLRDFLRPLAIFDGGWTEEWAEKIYEGHSQKKWSVAHMLQKLLDDSMVTSREAGGVTRFRMLEPVRQFVRKKLTRAEAEEHERNHALCFAFLAEQAEVQLLKGDQAKWLALLQLEIDNIRGAFRWAKERRDAETALRIAGSIWRFFEIRGPFDEGRGRAEEAIDMDEARQYPELLEKALSGGGWLAYRESDFAQAETLLTAALSLAEQLGNQARISNASNDLGNIARIRGQYDLARQRLTRCLESARLQDNKRMISVSVYNLGAVALEEYNLDEAARRLAESLEGFRDQANARESAFPLRALAEIALLRGDLNLARDYAQESLHIRKSLNDSRGRAETLSTLAWIEIHEGKFPLATEYLKDCFAFAKAISDRRTISEALEIAALALFRIRNIPAAAQLLAGAGRIRQRIGFAVQLPRKKFIDAIIAAAEIQLGSAEFQGLRARGESRDTDALIALACHPQDFA